MAGRVASQKSRSERSAATRWLESWLGIVLVSLVLSVLFWGNLWAGDSIIGGDTYTYYFPQKLVYSQELQAGRFPLWHRWTGFGYPLLGESQTGVFYPWNVLLYRQLEVSRAYSLNQAIHYVLCAMGMYWCARRMGLGRAGAWLATIVYTYGWFPCRLCLEWAIIGGAWLPWALGCLECYLETRRSRWLFALSAVLGVQLLAGHYHIAFITDLVLVAHLLWRTWLTRPLPSANAGRGLLSKDPSHSASEVAVTPAAESIPLADTPAAARAAQSWWTRIAGQGTLRHLVATSWPVLIAVGCGFGLAAVQVVPTWELKQRSQRAELGEEHDPAYGFIPPLYWSQIVAPWSQYRVDDIDGSLNRQRWWSPPSNTNKIEAHLYFGQIPLWLLVWGLIRPWLGGRPWPAVLRLYPLLGLLSLIYTSGWFTAIANHVPGFSFFHAPGRYGLITTLAVALGAGWSLQTLIESLPKAAWRWGTLSVIYLGTLTDLWLVSGMVTYAYLIPQGPVTIREQSPVRRVLHQASTPARLYAPGQNLCNLLEVPCVWIYLGIGPREYFDPALRIPDNAPAPAGAPPTGPLTDAKVDWLRTAGVTHVLSFTAIDSQRWPVQLVWRGVDPLLHSAWGRDPNEPLYLYELRGSLGRYGWEPYDESQRVEVLSESMNGLRLRVRTDVASTLTIRELDFPGWRVWLNGQPATAIRQPSDKPAIPFRQVALPPGEHTLEWRYQPDSFRYGLLLSAATGLLLAALGHVRFWHRRRTEAWWPG